MWKTKDASEVDHRFGVNRIYIHICLDFDTIIVF